MSFFVTYVREVGRRYASPSAGTAARDRGRSLRRNLFGYLVPRYLATL